MTASHAVTPANCLVTNSPTAAIGKDVFTEANQPMPGKRKLLAVLPLTASVLLIDGKRSAKN